MEKVIHVLATGGWLKRKPGLERLIDEMAFAQKKIGLDVAVWKICNNHPNDSGEVHSELFPRRGTGFFLSPEIKTAVNNLPPKSILHFHGSLVAEYFSLSKYIRKNRNDLKIIVSSHGGYSELNLRRLSIYKKAYFYFFEHLLIRNASLIHLVGPTETSGYKFYVNSSKPILTLPNGLSSFDKNGHMENDDPKNLEKFIIGYSGEFEIKRKGLDTLIESFKLFSEEVTSPVALWLIGRGDDEVALQKLVQHHGLENKVKLFSNHDKQLTKNLIQQAHVFVQPSRVDCIPMTALTAASCGVPLIITEETNLCKFIRKYEAGWCLSKLDEENLKQALHEAYFIYQTDEVKAQTIARNSYRMIREELNWNALSRKWEEAYLSVS